MKNVMRVIFYPLALYVAVYWSCFELFHWMTIEERSPWTRKLGGKNPIEDAMDLARDLVNAGR